MFWFTFGVRQPMLSAPVSAPCTVAALSLASIARSAASSCAITASTRAIPQKSSSVSEPGSGNDLAPSALSNALSVSSACARTSASTAPS